MHALRRSYFATRAASSLSPSWQEMEKLVLGLPCNSKSVLEHRPEGLLKSMKWMITQGPWSDRMQCHLPSPMTMVTNQALASVIYK